MFDNTEMTVEAAARGVMLNTITAYVYGLQSFGAVDARRWLGDVLLVQGNTFVIRHKMTIKMYPPRRLAHGQNGLIFFCSRFDEVQKVMAASDVTATGLPQLILQPYDPLAVVSDKTKWVNERWEWKWMHHTGIWCPFWVNWNIDWTWRGWKVDRWITRELEGKWGPPRRSRVKAAFKKFRAKPEGDQVPKLELSDSESEEIFDA